MTRPTLGGVWRLAQSDNTPPSAERIAICFAGVRAILLGVQLVRRSRSLAHVRPRRDHSPGQTARVSGDTDTILKRPSPALGRLAWRDVTADSVR